MTKIVRVWNVAEVSGGGHLQDLAVVPRWTSAHDGVAKLAFQGNVRAWPEDDYKTVKAALERAA